MPGANCQRARQCARWQRCVDYLPICRLTAFSC